MKLEFGYGTGVQIVNIPEKNLLDMVRQKEEADKNLLTMEVVIGSFSTLFLLTMVFFGHFLIPLWAYIFQEKVCYAKIVQLQFLSIQMMFGNYIAG